MKRLQSLRHLLLALPLLAALLCTSCQRHSAVWPQLLEAEALLDTDLPAAAPLLDSLDATPLRGEDAALYAILKTQADYKRYVPLTSDSLPRLATAYYGTPYRKNYHAAMAWYSLGCYYTELKDEPAAIDAYLKAKDCFPDTTVRYYALTEQNLGRHYLNRNILDEALVEFNACKSNLNSLQDSTTVAYVEYERGLCFLYIHEYSKADSLFMLLYENPIVKRNTSFLENCTFQLAKITFHRDSLEKSMNYLNQCLSMASNPERLGAVYSMQGNIAYKQGNIEQAYRYYQHSLSCLYEINTCCTNYKYLAEVSLLLGRTDSILYYLSQHDALLDSIYILNSQQSIDAVVAEHVVEMNEWKENSRHTRQTIIIVATLMLLATFAAYGFRSYHFRQKEQYMLRITMLQDKVHVLTNALAEIQQSTSSASLKEMELTDLTMAKYETNDMLCQLFSASIQLYTEKYKAIHHSLLKSSPSLELLTDERKKILQVFGPAFAEPIAVMQRSYATVTKEELLSALCHRLGYRSKLISDLFAVSPSGLRSRKLRLKSKISPDLFSFFYPSSE